MIVLDILEKDDLMYPLPKEIFYNANVLYHGTSNVFASEIMDKGWVTNDQPYSFEDILYVCSVFESISYYASNSYMVLNSFTRGGVENYHVGQKYASFSQNYWYARNYATNIGGETIKYLTSATRDLLHLIDDPAELSKYKQKVKEGTAYPFYNKELRLNALNNLPNIHSYKKRLMEILNKYLIMTSNTYPVVFALMATEEQIEKWIIPKKESYVLQWQMNFNLRACTDIPALSIIARINFPNGANRFTYYMSESLLLPFQR
jgi:hypothetical protein